MDAQRINYHPRIYLRETLASDAAVMFALNSDPEVLRYTGNEPFKSMEKPIDFLTNYSDFRENTLGQWAAVRKANEAAFGWFGLKLHANGMVDWCFMLFKKARNEGYATQAALAWLEHGFNFLGLNKISWPANARAFSVCVLRKYATRFSR